MHKGLYQPDQFRDNCGFGLIAHMQGQSSHHLLGTAIEALTCMTHRGGINADGRTGDGCGLLLQMPDQFMRAIVRDELGGELPAQYAVGMIFCGRDEAAAQRMRAAFAAALADQQLPLLGWRQVPVDDSVLGPLALSSRPAVSQVFVDGSQWDEQQLAIRLFYVRRRVELALQAEADFYICSLSARVISYKGLMMPADLTRFYPDLGDERMHTAICVFHQRFSTNTLPRWPLAQPFRLLAHNGEINTITANRNWAQARRNKFANPLLPDLDSLAPLVNVTGSDSSSMDNMLELLLSGGM